MHTCACAFVHCAVLLENTSACAGARVRGPHGEVPHVVCARGVGRCMAYPPYYTLWQQFYDGTNDVRLVECALILQCGIRCLRCEKRIRGHCFSLLYCFELARSTMSNTNEIIRGKLQKFRLLFVHQTTHTNPPLKSC